MEPGAGCSRCWGRRSAAARRRASAGSGYAIFVLHHLTPVRPSALVRSPFLRRRAVLQRTSDAPFCRNDAHRLSRPSRAELPTDVIRRQPPLSIRPIRQRVRRATSGLNLASKLRAQPRLFRLDRGHRRAQRRFDLRELCNRRVEVESSVVDTHHHDVTEILIGWAYMEFTSAAHSRSAMRRTSVATHLKFGSAFS